MLVLNLENCQSHSVMGLAMLAEHEEFLAEDACKEAVEELWSGGIKHTENLTYKVSSREETPVFAQIWPVPLHTGSKIPLILRY